MANFNFPCKFIKVEDGSEIVRCRDLLELLSWSVDGQPLQMWARDAVEDCLSFRIKDGEKIPEASAAQDGEFVVDLSTEKTAKILLHNAMVDCGMTSGELAKMTGLELSEVARLLDFRQTTEMDWLVSALESIGEVGFPSIEQYSRG